MAAVEEMDVPLRVLPAALGPDLKIEVSFCRKTYLFGPLARTGGLPPSGTDV
jgi:hypothetical protein